MRRLGDADIRLVLEACPRDLDAERQVCLRLGTWGVYEVSALEDLASFRVQLPEAAWSPGLPKGRGTIREIFPHWKAWCQTVEGALDLANHECILGWYREGDGLSVRPLLLGPKMQVLEGRHRLLALYEYWTVDLKGGVWFPFRVFWSQVP